MLVLEFDILQSAYDYSTSPLHISSHPWSSIGQILPLAKTADVMSSLRTYLLPGPRMPPITLPSYRPFHDTEASSYRMAQTAQQIETGNCKPHDSADHVSLATPVANEKPLRARSLGWRLWLVKWVVLPLSFLVLCLPLVWLIYVLVSLANEPEDQKDVGPAA